MVCCDIPALILSKSFKNLLLSYNFIILFINDHNHSIIPFFSLSNPYFLNHRNLELKSFYRTCLNIQAPIRSYTNNNFSSTVIYKEKSFRPKLGEVPIIPFLFQSPYQSSPRLDANPNKNSPQRQRKEQWCKRQVDIRRLIITSFIDMFHRYGRHLIFNYLCWRNYRSRTSSPLDFIRR